jgi:hypothetical protein
MMGTVAQLAMANKGKEGVCRMHNETVTSAVTGQPSLGLLHSQVHTTTTRETANGRPGVLRVRRHMALDTGAFTCQVLDKRPTC